MQVAGLVFAAIAVLLHVYIFVLESLLWTSDGTRRVFGLTPAQAEQTKQFAFNQGFYNLFLAVIAGAGLVIFVWYDAAVGTALMTAGLGAMAAAGLVLAISDPRKLRAALTQLTPPALALACLYLS